MKKIIFYFSLVALYAVPALAQNKHAKADVWIDRFDFEASGLRNNANHQTLGGESWTAFTDYTVNGESMVSKIYPIDNTEHGKVLELKYALNQGKSKYNPYVALLCATQAAAYPKHIVYVAYDYKGPAHSFMFNTKDVTDFNYFRKEVPASNDWTTVLIPLADLKQTPTLAKGALFNPEQLNGLEWFLQGVTGEAGSLRIDNIRFVYTPIEGRNYQE